MRHKISEEGLVGILRTRHTVHDVNTKRSDFIKCSGKLRATRFPYAHEGIGTARRLPLASSPGQNESDLVKVTSFQ